MADPLFIGHASDDATVVNRIVDYLEARGVPCWISSRDIPPRALYAEAITAGIQAASACAFVISKTANESKAVKRELELASHFEKPLIPIRIDGSEPAAGVDYYLRNVQWMDYKRDGNHALDRIVAHIKGAPPPTARPLSSTKARVLPLAALALVLIGAISAGGWYAWTQLRPEQTVQSATVDPSTLTALLGGYNWVGLECGQGPTVTYEDSALVFTMQDTSTYRHEVLSAVPATDGNALSVQTRVIAPADHVGETYTLGLDGDTLIVTTAERTDTWTRCTPPATVMPSTAPGNERTELDAAGTTGTSANVPTRRFPNETASSDFCGMVETVAAELPTGFVTWKRAPAMMLENGRSWGSSFRMPGAELCSVIERTNTDPASSYVCYWNTPSAEDATRDAETLLESLRSCPGAERGFRGNPRFAEATFSVEARRPEAHIVQLIVWPSAR
jgi:hypothetical protein